MSEGDHLAIHPVDADPLFVDQAQGQRCVRECRGSAEPLGEDVVGRYSADEAARGDDGQGVVLLDPGRGGGGVLVPVAVNDAVENGLARGAGRDQPYCSLGEAASKRDAVVGCVHQGFHARDLFQQADPTEDFFAGENVPALDVQARPTQPGAWSGTEQQRSRFGQAAVHGQQAELAEHVLGSGRGDVAGIIVDLAAADVLPGDRERTRWLAQVTTLLLGGCLK